MIFASPSNQTFGMPISLQILVASYDAIASPITGSKRPCLTLLAAAITNPLSSLTTTPIPNWPLFLSMKVSQFALHHLGRGAFHLLTPLLFSALSLQGCVSLTFLNSSMNFTVSFSIVFGSIKMPSWTHLFLLIHI
jgi:hypothetical protein